MASAPPLGGDTSPIPAVPEEVLISLGQIAESAKEGLLALAVGAGMQVMYAMMDADVVALVGPKGKHVPERAAVRHGHEDGSVTIGGEKVDDPDEYKAEPIPGGPTDPRMKGVRAYGEPDLTEETSLDVDAKVSDDDSDEEEESGDEGKSEEDRT